MDNEELKAAGPDNHPSDSTGPSNLDLPKPEASAPQPQEDQHPAQDSQDQTALVRYGRMNMLGEFRRPEKTIFAAGTKVIVRTERGIELGRIVLAYCEGSGDRGVSRQRWQDYLNECGLEESISQQGQILRAAAVQDLIDQRHLDQAAEQKLQFCRELIDQMGLDMKPVAVEHLFGGDRILF